MSKQVISYKNFPSRPPLVASVLAWLCLDFYAAPGWVWGVVLTVMGLLWIGFFFGFHDEQTVDLFADGPHAANGRNRAPAQAVR